MNSCRVCMEPDKDQKFSSMFVDNGKNASRFFLLTGLIVSPIKCKIFIEFKQHFTYISDYRNDLCW